MMSSRGLPSAMVMAKPRNGTPSTAPIISAECALSMGSKKSLWSSPAMSARMEAAIPAVTSARTLTRKILDLL